jgi:hypothetical protein
MPRRRAGEEDRRRPVVELDANNRQPPRRQRGIHGFTGGEALVETGAESDGGLVVDGRLHGDHGRNTRLHQGGGGGAVGVLPLAAWQLPGIAGVQENQPQAGERFEVLREHGARDRLPFSVRPDEANGPLAALLVETTVPEEVEDVPVVLEKLLPQIGEARLED